MAENQAGSTRTAEEQGLNSQSIDLLGQFKSSITNLSKAIRTASRRSVRLDSNSFYSTKVRSELASFRKSFLALRDKYPQDRFQSVAFQLSSIEPLVDKVFSSYPSSPDDMLASTSELSLKVDSDLAHALENANAEPLVSNTVPLIPNELILPKHFVLKKILWEIN
jgi:hypothetical protein